MGKVYALQKVNHKKTCEISLGWAEVCDCGADDFNKALLRLVRQRKKLATPEEGK